MDVDRVVEVALAGALRGDDQTLVLHDAQGLLLGDGGWVESPSVKLEHRHVTGGDRDGVARRDATGGPQDGGCCCLSPSVPWDPLEVEADTEEHRACLRMEMARPRSDQKASTSQPDGAPESDPAAFLAGPEVEEKVLRVEWTH